MHPDDREDVAQFAFEAIKTMVGLEHGGPDGDVAGAAPTRASSRSSRRSASSCRDFRQGMIRAEARRAASRPRIGRRARSTRSRI